MADKRDQKQVSLASTAGVSKQKKKKRKKKVSTGTKIIRVMVAILVILALAFVGIIAYGLISSFADSGDDHKVEVNTYDTTPEAQNKKVSYFLLGVNGKDENSAMDMLSLLCYDKKQNTMQVLQVPTDTYIGNNGTFAVSRVGNVWNNPKPLVWCETCRKQVFEPEQVNGKHSICDTPLTQKTGSSVENLTAVFNDQLSMPVDNYFLLSQETLVQLVDLVGGIDVDLEAAMKVGEINYPKGKAILDGKAALYYAHTMDFNNTPAKDLARFTRQRKVFTAILQRLTAMDEATLNKSVISPIMTGANPLRTNTDGVAVAKMLAGVHSGSTENVTYAAALSELLHRCKKMDLTKSGFYALPGHIAKQGAQTYYSIKRAETVTLLQNHFNPYGLELKDEHLQISELPASGNTAAVADQTFDQLQVEQSAATTTAATTSTTAAAS